MDNGGTGNKRKADNGATFLLSAILDGDAAAVRAALVSGSDPDERDTDVMTALMRAVWLCENDKAIVLVDAGADVNACDGGGVTVLMAAARDGAAGFVTMLIEHGSDIFATDSRGMTAEEHARECGETLTAGFLAAAREKAVLDAELRGGPRSRRTMRM